MFAVRVPAAFQTTAVNIRLLDDLVIQSLLLVFGSFALVRYSYTRRIQRIEDATPELLERLASLNEAGMTVVESLRRLRGSDIGVLTPEVERIWADIKMGANVDDALVRFGRRIRTTAITRVVTLLTNAMHSSGQLGPVLRIASKQARADTRLGSGAASRCSPTSSSSTSPFSSSWSSSSPFRRCWSRPCPRTSPRRIRAGWVSTPTSSPALAGSTRPPTPSSSSTRRSSRPS
ncbi:type II secretion system F family protein [Halomicroarcula sp. GCM10025709]|uniref:type II secretion system F family protein n=1 Tax=Halomicroarcula sp. GCM10025709 TaxID=3252669 RepID=UPI00360792A9